MLVGYWPSTFFPENYWINYYWPGFVAGHPGNFFLCF